MDLPIFKYHPDPVATGSIVKSANTCMCCGTKRDYIYVGPVFSRTKLNEKVCPWCIADGSTYSKFTAKFTDPEEIGGSGTWDEVPSSVIEEVSRRTPGFVGWQQERWWTHCSDAGEFLGAVGYREANALGNELLQVLCDQAGIAKPQRDAFLRTLDKSGSPRAYVFRCRHCGTLGGYSDRQ